MQDIYPKQHTSVDLYITAEEEDTTMPYSKFRKWIIGRESQLNIAKGNSDDFRRESFKSSLIIKGQSEYVPSNRVHDENEQDFDSMY